MKKIFTPKKLLKFGLEGSKDSLIYWRTLLINWLVIISCSIGFVLIFINLYFETYFQAGLTTLGIVLMLVVFWLNKIGKQNLASLYYIFLCISILFMACIDALQDLRFTGSENVLYVFLLASVMLFDRGKLFVVFMLICIEIFYLNYYKSQLQITNEQTLFALQIVNVVVVIISLYAFATMFKKVLLKSLAYSLEQKQLLYTLIDNIPLFIGIYDANGRYKMVNLSYVKAYNMTREEIIGKKMRDVVHPLTADVYEPHLARALKGEIVDFHEKTIMKDESILMTDGRYVPIYNEKNEVISVTVAFHDITKLDKIRKELEKANKSKDKLFSIVSHDIKSPLNNFQSLLKISRNKIIDQHEFITYVEKLQNQFNPILNTVDGLLVWSKMQLKEMKPVFENVQIAPILEEILAESQPNLEEKEISLIVAGKQDDLYADLNHLKIILRNTIVNAIKFTSVQGTVDIKLSQNEGMGLIVINDSGVGMAEDKIESILSGGFYESSIGTQGEKGTGLGLKICTELIASNNGQFKISSNLDSGSTFEISLPLV